MSNHSCQEVVLINWQIGQGPPVAFPFLVILYADVKMSAVILLDKINKGADNLHINLGDVARVELGIFKHNWWIV